MDDVRALQSKGKENRWNGWVSPLIESGLDDIPEILVFDAQLRL